MIYGIGCDIVEIERMRKWVEQESAFIDRFFNERERLEKGTVNRRCEFYAGRFAAKEAFSKALGTGISGFSLKEAYACSGEGGRPFFVVEGKARELLEERCGAGAKVHISISHEKEYALAYAVIETN